MMTAFYIAYVVIALFFYGRWLIASKETRLIAGFFICLLWPIAIVVTVGMVSQERKNDR